MLPASAEIWLQRENETDADYDLFCRYRDIGPGRNMRSIFGTNPAVWDKVNKLRHTFNWADRVRAYDIYIRSSAELAIAVNTAEEYARTVLARRDAVREVEWELATRLFSKVAQMLDFPLVETRTTQTVDGKVITIIQTPARWSIRDAAALLEVASKMVRLSTEMGLKEADNKSSAWQKAIMEAIDTDDNSDI